MKRLLTGLLGVISLCVLPLWAQTKTPGTNSPARPTTASSSAGSINGTIVDGTGAVIVGARIQLLHHDNTQPLETHSDSNGQFFFPRVVPGNFDVVVAAQEFATQTVSGTLQPTQVLELPRFTLAIAKATSDVQVSETQEEIAEDQIKMQEQQRVLGVIPNFYVTYIPNAAPLVPGQKFKLAWKTLLDPSAFVITGVIAGVQQATDTFNGYGQGAEGYAKRYGAGYADFAIGTMITSAVLPSVFKQDPRYFYKGTGGTRARVDYALANAVICKGDNGRWQPNYSSILGNLAAGGISNLYYPAQDRNGAALTFENAAIGIGASAAANIIQEFIIPRLTPHKPGLKGSSANNSANKP